MINKVSIFIIYLEVVFILNAVFRNNQCWCFHCPSLTLLSMLWLCPQFFTNVMWERNLRLVLQTTSALLSLEYCPTTQCQFNHSRKGQCQVLTLMVTAMTATMMMTGSECGRVIAPPMVAPRRVWTRTAHRLTNASSPATSTNTNQDFSHRYHHYHHHSPLLYLMFQFSSFAFNTNDTKIIHLWNNKRLHLAVI